MRPSITSVITMNFQGADAVILPGSKNTTEDLWFLKEHGWDQRLRPS